MHRIFLLLIWLIPTFLSLSCTTNSGISERVVYGDRSTLAFSGKGAAAGMMMDAYMGGAGVAIGIAIDEGIAKDIATNISSRPDGFDMIALAQKELLTNIKSKNSKTNRQQISATKITIEKFGFHSAKGEGDKVSAWLKIRFSNQDGDVIVSYPDDFTSPAVIEFNDAKKNPELAFNTLKDATDLILDKWISTLK